MANNPSNRRGRFIKFSNRNTVAGGGGHKTNFATVYFGCFFGCSIWLRCKFIVLQYFISNSNQSNQRIYKKIETM